MLRQKVLTATDSGTLWFSSELFAGSFNDICGDDSYVYKVFQVHF